MCRRAVLTLTAAVLRWLRSPLKARRRWTSSWHARALRVVLHRTIRERRRRGALRAGHARQPAGGGARRTRRIQVGVPVPAPRAEGGFPARQDGAGRLAAVPGRLRGGRRGGPRSGTAPAEAVRAVEGGRAGSGGSNHPRELALQPRRAAANGQHADPRADLSPARHPGPFQFSLGKRDPTPARTSGSSSSRKPPGRRRSAACATSTSRLPAASGSTPIPAGSSRPSCRWTRKASGRASPRRSASTSGFRSTCRSRCANGTLSTGAR